MNSHYKNCDVWPNMEVFCDRCVEQARTDRSIVALNCKLCFNTRREPIPWLDVMSKEYGPTETSYS